MKDKPTASNNTGKKMSLLDIAEEILRERGGQGLKCGEIVDAARKQGLIDYARGNVAHSLYSAIHAKIKNDQESGKTPVFSIDRGLISLVSGKLRGTVEVCRQEARERIKDALRKIPAPEFESFIASVVLPCLNFEETSTTQATRDGGIDATGMLRTGTVQLFGTTKVKCFVQIKNWGKTKVSDKVVREVYGAAGERSKASHLSLRMIFTMSDYTAKAKETAENLGVCLYTGDDIMDILIKNERGVKNEIVPVPDYDYFKGGWKEQDN